MHLSGRLLALVLPLVMSAQTPQTVPEIPVLETAPVAETPAAVPIVETPAAAPAVEAQPGVETAQSPILLFYREKRFAGAILNTSVFVDDVEIADMDNGTYLKVKVISGEHTIRADEKRDEMVVSFEAGKIYYFRMGLAFGFWKGHGKLEPVDATTGAKQFTEWKPKLVYAKDIRKPEMVVQD